MTLVRIVELRDVIGKELHSRTPDVMKIRDRVVLVGAGGVGTWLAIALALSADPEHFSLMVIDDDKLELSNLNRLPYPPSEAIAGRRKAEALANHLRALRPWLRVEYMVARVEDADELANIAKAFHASVLVDATDNPRGIRLVKEAAKKAGTHYLGAHYDGTSYTIEWLPREAIVISEWLADDQGGYQVFPSTVQVPMMVASIAATLIAVKPRKRILITSDIIDDVLGDETRA